ncbi:MAG: glycosyltransferase family 39 protein [Candidatus Acidiferrum sp.]
MSDAHTANGTTQETTGESRPAVWALLGGFAILAFVLHTFLYRGYGFFRDELYFIACSRHLDWGYVDQPPGVAVLAWLGRHLFGDTLFAVRFFPIVFVSLLIILVGLTARAMGGSRFAVGLASLCAFAVPQYFGTWLNTDMFMMLGWAACAWIATRIFSGESPRLWVWFGVFAGLALQGKHAMVLFGFAFAVGLLLSDERRHFGGRWLWLGCLSAFLIALPNIIWEIEHHWATYELLSNIAHSGKNVVLGPLNYLASNIMSFTLLPSIIAFVGLGWLLFNGRAKPFRALGWTWLVSFLLMILLKGKDYYLTPVYSTLFAAGSVGTGWWIDGLLNPLSRKVIKASVLALTLLGCMVGWPFAMPMMPVEKFIAYEAALGIQPSKTETNQLARLPQQYADQFGWPEMGAQVAKVYNAIPETDRQTCGIFAQNYGEAAAIDYFGRRYGLPPAISGHQNYFYWGPRGFTGSCLIVIGRTREQLRQQYETVIEMGELYHPYAMPFENHREIWIVHGPKYGTLQDAWPAFKLWI